MGFPSNAGSGGGGGWQQPGLLFLSGSGEGGGGGVVRPAQMVTHLLLPFPTPPPLLPQSGDQAAEPVGGNLQHEIYGSPLPAPGPGSSTSGAG
jgi:hypothetical protein